MIKKEKKKDINGKKTKLLLYADQNELFICKLEVCICSAQYFSFGLLIFNAVRYHHMP